MRIADLFFSAALGTYLLSSPASTADVVGDVATCKASDHYHDLVADYKTCDRALKQIGLTDETRSQLLAGRGEDAFFIGRNDLAIVDLDEAIKLNPENREAHLHRAWTLYHLQKYQLMRSDLDFLLSKNQDDADALFAMGYLYYNSPEWPTKTEPMFKRALEINPNHYLARYNLAALYQDRYNKPDLAVNEYDKILAASDGELRKVKSRSYQGGKSYDFKGAVRYQRVIAQMNTHNTSGILEELTNLAKQYPNVADTFTSLANYKNWQQKWDGALADAETALNLDKNQYGSKTAKLLALYRLKRYQDGLDFANAQLTEECNSCGRAGILNWRANFKKLLHDNEGALRDVEDAINEDPNYAIPVLLTQLIQSKYYKGQVTDSYSESVRNGLKACIIDPECAL